MFAALIGACAAIGVAVSLFVAIQLLRHDWTNYKQDHLAYGLLPMIAYLALLVAAAMIWSEIDLALDVLAGALLALLIVNIRNAWDLTLSMVRHQAGRRRVALPCRSRSRVMLHTAMPSTDESDADKADAMHDVMAEQYAAER